MHTAKSKSLSEEPIGIATRLEQVVSSIFTAINDRHFDATRAPWTRICEDFRFDSTGSPCQVISGSGFINYLKDITDSYPSFRTEVSKLEGHVYPTAGYAEVYANVQSVGGEDVPLVMKRKSVAVYKFRLNAIGDWMASTFTNILGLNDEMDMVKSPADEEKLIRAHFEKVISNIFDSINTRSFDPGQSHWVSVAPDFSVSSPGAPRRASTKVEFIDYLRQLTKTYASFEMKLGVMDMHMYKPSGYAEVYANAENIGGDDVPLAMKRRSVGVYEFRRVHGEVWLATRLTSMMGADLGGPG